MRQWHNNKWYLLFVCVCLFSSVVSHRGCPDNIHEFWKDETCGLCITLNIGL